MQSLSLTACRMGLLMSAVWLGSGIAQDAGAPPIQFSYRPIPFVLENSETPRRYAPETMPGGVAAFDYDNDGDLDIYFANGADVRTLEKSDPKYQNRLFANDGSGVFTDVTEGSGLAGTGFDYGVSVADYDNDGDQDVFVAGLHRYSLFRNEGDGTFSEVTEAAGLAEPDEEYGPLWAVGGAWLDADSDGWLDLFVVNYFVWKPELEPTCGPEGALDYCHPRYFDELPNRLYRNQGDGTFADISAQSGIRDHPGKGMGAAVADFDRDGLPDIFVTNDKMYNSLFHNLGDLRFEETAFESGTALLLHGAFVSGMGADARDLNNDGLPDIVFVALDYETFPLFLNTGDGVFEDATATSGMVRLSREMAGYSPAIYDFDNDGWKDIFVSRGHVQSPSWRGRVGVDQHNTVFRNLGNGKMEALTDEAGLAKQPRKRHRGTAQGDFNGDGRIDVVVSALSAEAEIWMNESPGGNHWLALDLEGDKSNRDGIGAEVKVVTEDGAQYNHATTAVGYASSSAGPVHFGLGEAERASLVEIRWPSGRVQELRDVAADQVVKVWESDAN